MWMIGPQGVPMLADLDRVRDALHAIPPDLPREDWVRVGMAAHAAGLPFDDFDAWSAGADNYDARAARDTWRSFKEGGGVGLGTLLKMAKQFGWRPGNKSTQPRPAKALVRPQARPTSIGPAVDPAELWARFEPATSEHPYLLAKQICPSGLRVVPADDDLIVEKYRVAGWLVVPASSLDGTLRTLQFIPPPGAGEKRSLKGGQFLDSMFIVGDVTDSTWLYVAEGIGQAEACLLATGDAAAVCFGASRMATVARALREKFPDLPIRLVPDRGKEAEAAKIASAIGGDWVELPADKPSNYDAHDYATEYDHDALAELLRNPKTPSRRFRLLRSSDLHELPPLEWRIRGVLPTRGLASVYGPSGSGKSFLVLDAAAAIAEGVDWFGYRVKPAPVVYCPLEGEAGFRLRVAAWEEANGRTLPADLRLVIQPFKLTDPQDVADLAEAVLSAGNGAVTIIDTLNRAAPEADENTSADMGRILEAAKALERLTGGLVLVVHHTGKDAAKGLRGHSSLNAALDAAIEVTRDGDRREWRVAKAKDGQDGAGHPFRLEVVDLGEDDDGEAVTSCVVVPDESPQSLTRCRLPKGGNQKVVLDALGELLRASTKYGMAGAPAVRPCVAIESAVEAIAPRLTCEPKRQRERVRQSLTGLVASGVVMLREGWLWLP